jgi:formyl-CoA transferase
MMESLVPEYALGGYTRERTGATLPNIAPSNVYPSADGEMVLIAANQDTVFRRLAGVMGRPDLVDDERFSNHAARGRNQEELDRLIAEWTAEVKADDLLRTLDENGVPAGRIYKASDMLEDPHFQAREDIVEVPHPVFGSFPMHGVFPRLSRTPGRVRWVGPELGQHNEEVYGDLLGLSAAQRHELHTRGVI